jgi:hypothetical protein
VREIERKKDQTFTGRLTLSVTDRKLASELTIVEANGQKNPPYRKSQSGAGTAKQAEAILAAAGRAGVFVPIYILENWDDVKEKGWFVVDPTQLEASAPKFGKKEKISGREAQALEFTLTSKNGKLKISNVVWIDVERKVPLKWSGTITRGLGKYTFTETYEKIE